MRLFFIYKMLDVILFPFSSFCSALSCVSDCTPEVDDEIIGEPESLKIRVVDGLGEVHRVRFVGAQVPHLASQLVVVDAEERIEENVDRLDAALRKIVGLKLCFV